MDTPTEPTRADKIKAIAESIGVHVIVRDSVKMCLSADGRAMDDDELDRMVTKLTKLTTTAFENAAETAFTAEDVDILHSLVERGIYDRFVAVSEAMNEALFHGAREIVRTTTPA